MSRGVSTGGVRDEGPHGGPTWLLDVNVLLALLDPVHAHHDAAHAWFAATPRRWASCPLTENGAIRIMAHPSYPNRVDSPAVAAELVGELCRHPGHVFWPGNLSLLDSGLVWRERLLRGAAVTDTWLLALAVHNGGRLATFDRRLDTEAVRGGADACVLIG